MKPLNSSPETLETGKSPPNCFSILVVDDLPENRQLLGKILTAVGYQALTASNGTDAINQIVYSRPHLVIMDVEMPGMTGIEAVREIRRLPTRLADIPVIAASGNPDPAIKRDILAAGADTFLSKPMDVGMLIETIAALLQRHRTLRHSASNPARTTSAGVNEVGNAA